MGSNCKENSGGRSEEDILFLFGSIFKKHEEHIFRFALRITKSPQQARDIVQEVFIKLWEHRYELPTIQNPDAWLTTAVKNKVIDFMRKTSADERLKANLWKDIQQLRNSTEESFDAREADALIHKAVEELPEQRKTVYRLNRETGLSYQEIAEELSISKHTVKNQLYLAIRFLQKRLSI